MTFSDEMDSCKCKRPSLLMFLNVAICSFDLIQRLMNVFTVTEETIVKATVSIRILNHEIFYSFKIKTHALIIAFFWQFDFRLCMHMTSIFVCLVGCVLCSYFQLNPLNEHKRPSPGQPSCELFTNYRLHMWSTKHYSLNPWHTTHTSNSMAFCLNFDFLTGMNFLFNKHCLWLPFFLERKVYMFGDSKID